MITKLTEQQLTKLREIGNWKAIGERFVDPYIIAQCNRVLDARGERWAAAVLGRDISRRSIAVRNRPYLNNGEPFALILADRAENDAAFAEIIG